MLMKRNRLTLLAAIMAAIGVAAYWSNARADDPATIQIAIPTNVTINVGSHTVVFIGRPTSTSPVNCAPGTPNPQTVVAVEPGGGSAAQITGVLAFHDHEISLGSRYQITAGPNPCNSDFKLYTATLN